MAFCPECRSEMSATVVECPSCHYSFPKLLKPIQGSLAWSPLATAALTAGKVLTGFGCFVLVFAAIAALLRGELAEALIGFPIAFLMCFANFVVFARVSEMERPN